MTAASAQICARASSFTSVRRDHRPLKMSGAAQRNEGHRGGLPPCSPVDLR